MSGVRVSHRPPLPPAIDRLFYVDHHLVDADLSATSRPDPQVSVKPSPMNLRLSAVSGETEVPPARVFSPMAGTGAFFFRLAKRKIAASAGLTATGGTAGQSIDQVDHIPRMAFTSIIAPDPFWRQRQQEASMLSRRQLFIRSLSSVVALTTARTALGSVALIASEMPAQAQQGGGNGNAGNGNGGGNGNGNGASNGNASGNSGGQQGNSGGSSPASATPDLHAADGPPLEVRHRNGARERLANGRYVMRDPRGRKIVDRLATGTDRTRLRSLIDQWSSD